MKRNNKNIVGLLVVLSVVIVTAFLFKFLKQEEYTYYTSAKGEARYNQYLAAENLLEEYSFVIEKHNKISSESLITNNSETAIFISTSKIYQYPSVLKQLTRWVDQGGLLLLPGPDINQISKNKSGYDDFLPDLGIGFSLIEGSDSDDKEQKFFINDDQYMLEPNRHITIDSENKILWSIYDAKGVYALAINKGEGVLVVFNDTSLFSNRKIAQHEHARLFLNIFTKLSNDKNIATIKYILNPSNPSIIDALAKYPFSLLLFGSIVLGFFWINWGYLGPLKNKLSYEKMTMASHFLFSGQYLWRYVSVEKLYKSVFHRLETVISKQRHGWHQLSHQEKLNYIIEKTGLPESKVDSVLTYKAEKNKNSYYQFCMNCNLIRNKL